MVALRAQKGAFNHHRTLWTQPWASGLVSLRASQRPNDSPRTSQRAKRSPRVLYDGLKVPKVAIRSHFNASLEAPTPQNHQVHPRFATTNPVRNDFQTSVYWLLVVATPVFWLRV